MFQRMMLNTSLRGNQGSGGWYTQNRWSGLLLGTVYFVARQSSRIIGETDGSEVVLAGYRCWQ